MYLRKINKIVFAMITAPGAMSSTGILDADTKIPSNFRPCYAYFSTNVESLNASILGYSYFIFKEDGTIQYHSNSTNYVSRRVTPTWFVN